MGVCFLSFFSGTPQHGATVALWFSLTRIKQGLPTLPSIDLSGARSSHAQKNVEIRQTRAGFPDPGGSKGVVIDVWETKWSLPLWYQQTTPKMIAAKHRRPRTRTKGHPSWISSLRGSGIESHLQVGPSVFAGVRYSRTLFVNKRTRWPNRMFGMKPCGL